MHVAPGKVAVFLPGGREPAEHRVVVVGAEIADAVFIAAVRQIVRLAVGVKGKLHHPHAGQAGVLQQLSDRRGQIAEVLGDKLGIVEPARQHAHQGHARARTPAAVLRGGVAVGHGPVAVQPAEVVDAQHIIEEGGTLDAADPPAVAIRLHPVPVIERVAPELSVLGKGIGRNPGDLLRHMPVVQLEELRLAPDIRRVHRDIDGDVADQADALLAGIGLEGLPLAVEQELDKAVKVDLVLQLFRIGPHGKVPVHADVLVRPLGPADHAEVHLHGHIEGIV